MSVARLAELTIGPRHRSTGDGRQVASHGIQAVLEESNGAWHVFVGKLGNAGYRSMRGNMKQTDSPTRFWRGPASGSGTWPMRRTGRTPWQPPLDGGNCEIPRAPDHASAGGTPAAEIVNPGNASPLLHTTRVLHDGQEIACLASLVMKTVPRTVASPVPLLGREFSVPSQYGVRRDDGCQVH